MPNIRTNARSFSGGEVTPEFFGRIDDAKYQTGLAKCRNFICLPHGPVANRPGFAYVRETKDLVSSVRLIPFSFSTTQTMVLEFGNNYIRFHTEGGTLLSGGVPYEVVSPYSSDEVMGLKYVQSADVLTITNPNDAPRELRRLGALNWTISLISFTPAIGAPAGLAVTATRAAAPTNLRPYYYKVSAVNEDALDESLASAQAVTNVDNNLLQSGAFNTLTWSAVAGATRYKLYKEDNGLYGYIGETVALTFKDENISADLSVTPPQANDPFTGAGNYPGAVSYHQQRRVFAGTTNKPQNVWLTRSGTESNLTYSLPSRDDDAISFRVAAREANTIRHIVPLQDLVLLTSSAEWRVASLNSDVLTPNSVGVRPQSYIGANNVSPQIVNNNLIYCAARGGHVREMSYNWQSSGYITGDLSLRAPHLFDSFSVVDMAYAKSPSPIVWFVSSTGKLLGLTYVPEQQVGAWHQHDTDGAFMSICTVAEGDEDVLYAVVKRVINGVTKQFVERMSTRQFVNPEDAFFVDCGSVYDGVPNDVISGLGYLEGKTVSILANGAVHPPRVVTSGSITLDIEASKVVIGLPIEADLQTLPLAFEVQGFGQGRTKNVNKVWLRVYRSSGVFVGPTPDTLTEAKQRTVEPYGSPPALKTEEIQVLVTPDWTDNGQVFVRQIDPLPLTIVSMTMEVSVGA